MKAKRRTATQVREDCTVYDKPIMLQKQDETTELWTDMQHLHASVNKAGGSENFAAGADQFPARLLFKVRYYQGIEAVRSEPTLWRIVYNGEQYQVIDYDDYMEQHRVVRVVGERYV